MPSVSQLARARRSVRRASLCLCVVLTVCGAGLVRAEVPINPQRGYTPGNSFALGEVETINTTNGNLMFNFPLGRLTGGRGGPSAAIHLTYNSKLYDTQVEETLDDTGQIIPQYFLSDSLWGGWRISTWFDFEVVNRFEGGGLCNTPQAHFPWKLFMIFPDGGRREFRPVNFQSHQGYYGVHPSGSFAGCTGGGTTSTLFYYSTDGTYARLEFPHTPGLFGWRNNWTLSMPDGSRVVSTDSSRRFYDRNNNYIELQSVQNYRNTGLPASLLADQFGRSVAIQSISQTETRIHAAGFNDELVTWRVLWKTVHVKKDYRTVAVTDGRERGNSSTQTLQMSFKVVDRIILPAQAGGQGYVFGYNAHGEESEEESYGWGEVSSVTLPSGAHVAYDYKLDGTGVLQSNVNTNRALENSPTAKTVTYQAEYDGASSPVTEAWDYNIGNTGSCVVAPDGGATCQGHGDTSFENKMNGLVFRIDNPDGTRAERNWQHNYPIGFDQSYSANPYVKSEFLSLKDPSGNFTKTAIKDYNYDKNGNLTRVKEYDWVPYSSVHDAAGAPLWAAARPAVKRERVTTYHSPTPDATDATTSSFNAYYNGSAPLLRNAASSAETWAAGVTRSRAEFFYDSVMTTGNLVETRSWDDTRGPLLNLPGGGRLDASNSISTTNQYDQFGNVTLKTEAGRADGSRSQTRYVYGPVGGHANLYPTEEIVADGTPRARTTRREYDLWTGLVTRTIDVDNDVSAATEYDALGRQKLTVAAEGKPEETRTVTDYADALRRVTVRSDLNVAGDGKLVSVQHYDQLGRPRLSRRLENASAQDAADETTGIKVQTRYAYASANSHTLTSNPYRAALSSQATGEETMGWTVSTADRGGRVVRLETFAGASLPAPWGANAEATGAVLTVYAAEATTVTDQAGKSRQSVVDGLGRLAQVFEAPHDAGYNHQTSYEYDALGNLRQVQQGGQARAYHYSSLARLVSTTNPENGTTSYEYDPNGNLKRKTDPRGVTTNYAYDALNRLTFRNYSDATPDVTFGYDTAPNGAGRLSSVSNGVAVYSHASYDALGRVKASSQTVDGVTYSMPDYQYDLAGNLVSQQYPSGRVIRTEYDEAGRAAGVKNQATGHFYVGAAAADAANRLHYSVHGVVSGMRLGNGLWEHTQFNSRLQPVRIGLGATSAASDKLRLDYGYGPASANNGNVRTQRLVVAGALDLTQTYEYDPLNRLDLAREAPTGGGDPTWQQRFAYDPFGNRSFNAAETTDNVEGPAVAFNPANNRVTTAGHRYDAAGNLECEPARPCRADLSAYYEYDAEDRLSASDRGGSLNTAAVYLYDGHGRRVKKATAGGSATVFVYNAAGYLVAEYSHQVASGGTSYLTSDHLGSTRAVTGADGQPKSRHDYLPFGEEIGAGSGGRASVPGYSQTAGVRQKFTGKERDGETGLDYFGARYYAATQGRFTSADPVRLGADRLFDPQRLNLYAYVRNNPLAFTDPDGRDLILGTGDQKKVKKAVVEIAKRPGGREMLQKLDKLTIQIMVSTGETKGGHYGHTGPQDPGKRNIDRARDGSGDVAGDPLVITLDFDRAAKDRKENKNRAEVNKGMEAMGLPGKPLLENVPKSDAQLTGHEMAHAEFQLLKAGNTLDEDAVTGRIDAILAEPVDKNLAKDAEKFVDTLLQPNPQTKPTPPPPDEEEERRRRQQ